MADVVDLQAQLAALQAAYASGADSVAYDGKSVHYRSAEEMRAAIFEPTFTWNPNAAERTGRGLFKVREFAVAHSGSVWAESKTGKACTFFLRVRPDSVR